MSAEKAIDTSHEYDGAGRNERSGRHRKDHRYKERLRETERGTMEYCSWASNRAEVESSSDETVDGCVQTCHVAHVGQPQSAIVCRLVLSVGRVDRMDSSRAARGNAHSSLPAQRGMTIFILICELQVNLVIYQSSTPQNKARWNVCTLDSL